MKVVLIGYMGSGKTTLGRALSKITSLPFLDLDRVIEEKEQKSIDAIFQTKGEIYFRKKEATYLKEVLERNEAMILSLGGGTPCYGSVMQDLTTHPGVTTVYLKASVEELTQRLWPVRAHRPLISHLPNPEALNDFIRKHLFERTHFYMQAHVTLVVDGKGEKDLLEEMVLRLF